MARQSPVLSLAVALGAAALIPFAAGVYYAYSQDTAAAGDALGWLLAYAATIVGFIGGAQWGQMLALRIGNAVAMIGAVVPALMAWAALLCPLPLQTLLLLSALLVAWINDEYGARQGWQRRGFLWLRRGLTLAVLAAILAIGWRAI